MEGTSIYNFPEQLEIEIKKEHIEKGVAYAARKCALTLAILDVYPNASVSSCRTFVCIDEEVYKTSEELNNFIETFDLSGWPKSKPGTYKLFKKRDY